MHLYNFDDNKSSKNISFELGDKKFLGSNRCVSTLDKFSETDI